jgi:hypothetical protein
VAGEGGTEEVGRGETAEDVAEVVVVEDIDGRRHLGLRRRWGRNRGRRRWGFGFASVLLKSGTGEASRRSVIFI